MSEALIWDAMRRVARGSLAIVSGLEPKVRAAGHTEAAHRLREYACHLERVFTAQDAAELQEALQGYTEHFEAYEDAFALAFRSLDEERGDA